MTILNSCAIQSRAMRRKNTIRWTLAAYAAVRGIRDKTPADIATIATLKDTIKRLAKEQSSDRSRLRKSYFYENKERAVQNGFFSRPLKNYHPSPNGTGKKAIFWRFSEARNKDEFFKSERQVLERIFSSPESKSRSRFYRKQRTFLNELETLYRQA